MHIYIERERDPTKISYCTTCTWRNTCLVRSRASFSEFPSGSPCRPSLISFSAFRCWGFPNVKEAFAGWCETWATWGWANLASRSWHEPRSWFHSKAAFTRAMTIKQSFGHVTHLVPAGHQSVLRKSLWHMQSRCSCVWACCRQRAVTVIVQPMPQDGPIHSASLKPAVKDVASWCFQILKLLSDFPEKSNPVLSFELPWRGQPWVLRRWAVVLYFGSFSWVGRRCYGSLQIQRAFLQGALYCAQNAAHLMLTSRRIHDPKLYNILKHINLQ